MDAAQVQKLALKDEMAAAVWMRLCRRACFEQIRFPVGRNYEDIAVTFLPFEHAEKVGFLDRPFYNYRINKSGIAHQKKPLTRYQMFLSYRDCFDYACRHVPEVAGEIGSLTARFALGACLDREIEESEELNRLCPEAEAFLEQHRERLLKEWNMSRKLRLSFQAYFHAGRLLTKSYALALPLLKKRWSRQS